MSSIDEWVRLARHAERTAHKILSHHEQAASRVVILEDLVKRLAGAPVDVQDFFHEAITCLEQGVYRSAIVMAWAGQFHVLAETLYHSFEERIRKERPKWEFRDLSELKENVNEFQILEVAKTVGFISKSEMKILQGHLSTRNQCAHPTLYRPSRNTAIGFVDEAIQRSMVFLKL